MKPATKPAAPPPCRRSWTSRGADLAAVRATIAAFWNEDLARTFLTAPNLEEGSPRDLTAGHAVDLSHECLMRQWRQLRQWMALERDNAAQFRRLSEAQEKKRKRASSPDLPSRPSSSGGTRSGLPPFGPSATRPSAIRSPAPRRRGLKEGLLFLERSKRADRRRLWQRRAQWLVPVAVLIIAAFIYFKVRQQAVEATAHAAAEVAKAKAADETARAQMAEANLAVENEKRKAAETAYEAEKKRVEFAEQLTTAQQREALAKAQNETLLAEARNKEELSRRDRAYRDYQDQLLKEANDAKAKAETQRLLAVDRQRQAESETARANAAEVKSGVIRDVAGLVAQGKKGEALARLAYALRLDPTSLAAKTWIFDILVRERPSSGDLASAPRRRPRAQRGLQPRWPNHRRRILRQLRMDLVLRGEWLAASQTLRTHRSRQRGRFQSRRPSRRHRLLGHHGPCLGFFFRRLGLRVEGPQRPCLFHRLQQRRPSPRDRVLR